MEKAKLIELVKTLNGAVYKEGDAELPILETKIKFVAVKEPALKAAFITACMKLAGTKAEEHVSQEIIDGYNELVPEGADPNKVIAELTGAAPAPATADPAATVAEEKPKAEKKADKPAGEKKKGNLPVREMDPFGRVVDSMSGMFSAMLVQGGKLDAIAKAVAKKYGRTEERASGNLKGHMAKLKKEGFTITEKDGVFTLALPKK